MKHLKLFEDFNSRTPEQVAELLEDLFVEIFDKWEIKEIPVELLRGFTNDGHFFANLDTEDLYYKIVIFPGSFNTVILQIKSNIFQPSSIERFKEMVRDCQPVLDRLKSFGIDFYSDSQMYQNAYNFGRIQYFRVVVELPNKVSESYHNDEIDDEVCKYIGDDEYHYWRDKIVGAPHYKAIEIIKKQIAIVESDFSKEFDESKFVIGKDRVTYNGNPIYSSRHTDTELKMAVSYCGDDWYLVECYHNWYFYTFLCDDFIGLESLGQTIIDEIEK